jgi:hypothetical protein
MNNKLKMAGALVLSLLVSVFVSSRVFVAQTPVIREDLVASLKRIFTGKQDSSPQTTTVNAFDHDELYTHEFNQAEKRTEYTFRLANGKIIKIRIPSDVNPPPLQVVEEMVNK